MKFNYVIGMDMAKESFDLKVHNFDFAQEFINTPKDIRKMLKTLKSVLNTNLEECLFCFEHTGLYSLEMMVELEKKSLSYSAISGLELKKSLGISRGKSDPIDARRIAEYGFMRQDRIPMSALPTNSILKLKNLMSIRAMHVRNRASYTARMNEQFRILKKTEYSEIYNSQKRIINHLNKEIEKIEQAIKVTVNQDLKIKNNFDLLTSINGVGPVVATQMIVKTQCFNTFNDWRKFACYCGTAPFPNESGKQVNGKRISNIGDGEMKCLLTLAARTIMQHDPEIRLYVERKLAIGKSKKNITNCVRNKLLARMFAVVKRGTPYVPMYRFAC